MTISVGVATGATNMPQPAASKPGTPASAIVGMSGAVGQRLGDETPSARTFPAWIWGSEGSGSENRLLLRILDKISDGFDGQTGMDDQHEGNGGDQSERRKILGGVVWQLVERRRCDGERPAACHDQRVAVRGGTTRCGHTDRRCCPWTVFDDNGLT